MTRKRSDSGVERLERRRLLNGDLDFSFGDDGFVIDFLGGGDVSVKAAAMQSDDKIVIAGRFEDDAFVARFNGDGSRDQTFGPGGVVLVDLGAQETFNGVAVVEGGKIVAGGSAAADLNGADHNWLLVRFNADGTRDVNTRFGGGDAIALGKARGGISAMTVADGKIFTADAGTLRRHNLGTGNYDAGFSDDGAVNLPDTTDLSSLLVDRMAVAADGKIALAGTGSASSNEDLEPPFGITTAAVVLLNPDGTPDQAFDGNGIRIVAASEVGGVMFGADGSLFVAVGYASNASAQQGTEIFRFTRDGESTRQRAGGGTPLGAGLTPGNKVIVGGSNIIEAARFNANGTLDLSYSKDGIAYADALPVESGVVDPLNGAFVVDGQGRGVIASNFVQEDGTITGAVVLTRLRANPTGEVDPHLKADATLVVVGMAQDDDITVTELPAQQLVRVTANGEDHDFPAADVELVTLFGGGGDDVLRGSATLPATIDGGQGNDTLLGGDANETLRGGAGPADDTLDGGGGSDHLSDFSDLNTISYARHTVGVVIIANGSAQSGAPGENDVILNDFRYFVGGQGNDTITGNEQDNIISGGGGSDSMEGGDGNDVFYAEGDGDLDGGDDEIMIGGSGKDIMFGGPGDDFLVGGDGNDHLMGSGGDNHIDGGEGDDALGGGDGANTLFGGAGGDHISAGSGNDSIDGGDGNDRIRGGDGDDSIGSGDGFDTLYGEGGNDWLRGGGGKDRIYAGEGNDRAYGHGGNDQIFGAGGVDRLHDGIGSDYIDGGSSNDRLNGELGADTLLGQGGDDLFIVQDDGAVDELYGGSGVDSMQGFEAADVLASIESRSP